MSNPFKATHVITHNGRTIMVQEDDRVLYTEAEWESCGSADWSLGEEGELLFQGQARIGKTSIARLDRL